MSKQLIVNHYQKSDTIKQIVKELQQEQNHFQISNLVGSSLSFVLSETFKKAEKPYLLIFNDKEEAAYYLNDLEQLLGDKNVLFYPGSYRRPYQIEETDNANVLLRSEVLNRINSRRKPAIIVTYPTALFEKVVTKKELDKNTLKIKVGENLSPDFVNEVLFEYQFNRVDFVTEPGDFSVRGGIIDVFSFSNDEPYRMEFFGDEVESIRTFDVETQLSKEKQQKVSIM
ncbi:transcription-repair coupling factor, partial [Tenacibaculum finnmarkense]|nr:transcription-repair coupling factor [Tenacibaculum finnmarkense]